MALVRQVVGSDQRPTTTIALSALRHDAMPCVTPAKRAPTSPVKAERTPSHKMNNVHAWSAADTPASGLHTPGSTKSKALDVGDWPTRMAFTGQVEAIDTSYSLEFAPLLRKMDEFLLTYDAFVMGELAGAEMLRDEQAAELGRLARSKAQATEQLDGAKVEQERLWSDMARQKEEDERERQALAALEMAHQDQARRVGTVQGEVRVLEAQRERKLEQLEQKRAELHRARLSTQQDRHRLEELTGVKIVPQHGNLRVAFAHVDVNDAEGRASFVLEMSDERGYSGTWAGCGASQGVRPDGDGWWLADCAMALRRVGSAARRAKTGQGDAGRPHGAGEPDAGPLGADQEHARPVPRARRRGCGSCGALGRGLRSSLLVRAYAGGRGRGRGGVRGRVRAGPVRCTLL